MRWRVVMCAVLATGAGCGDDGPGRLPDAPVTIDAMPDAMADAAIDATPPCVTGSGPTTHSTSLSTDQTWTAAESPHVITANTSLTATLTLEDCAVVLIAPGITLSVFAAGKLVANGGPGRPVTIAARDAGMPFAAIASAGIVELHHTTIQGGGDPLNRLPYLAGAIDMQGVAADATQPRLLVDHVTIEGSASNGVVLRDGAGFVPASTALTISGAAQFPVSIWSRAAGTLPPGTYTGNATDEILLPGIGGNEAIAESMTLFDRGVPYRVGHDTSFGELRVNAAVGQVARLTIEPGVTLRFKTGGAMFVEPSTGTMPARGALIANGTTADPIIFTSANSTPAAGDWFGVWFGQVPDAQNAMSNVVVDYAGRLSASGSESCPGPNNNPSNRDGAIRILGLPSQVFVTSTTIRHSAGNAIDRGWRDDLKPDFLAGNTFENIAGCRQTHPRDSNGACPMIIPCP